MIPPISSSECGTSSQKKKTKKKSTRTWRNAYIFMESKYKLLCEQICLHNAYEYWVHISEWNRIAPEHPKRTSLCRRSKIRRGRKKCKSKPSRWHRWMCAQTTKYCIHLNVLKRYSSIESMSWFDLLGRTPSVQPEQQQNAVMHMKRQKKKTLIKSSSGLSRKLTARRAVAIQRAVTAQRRHAIMR